jgi:hypothetical protein
LGPRPPIYDRFIERDGFLDPALFTPTRRVQARLAAGMAAAAPTSSPA